MRCRLSVLLPVAAAAVLNATLAASIALAQSQGHTRGRIQTVDVPFVTTPHEAVAAMLRLAGVGPDDVVLDPGAGDGRIVIAAVRDFGAKKAVGIDINRKLVKIAQENIRKAGVSDRASVSHGDAMQADFSEATVMAMFMSIRINRELRPRMQAMMKPGSRVVSYRFPILGWEPLKYIKIKGITIYLYVVPKKNPAQDR